MSKFNFQMFLQAYNDSNYTNSPVQNNFRWTRNITGLAAENPQSDQFDLAPGESRAVIAGQRTLSQDIATAWQLALKPNTSNSYILSATGTQPNPRTPRAISSDATTQVTVTTNGPLMILTSTGGTAFNFGTVQVGDELRVGNPLNLTIHPFSVSNSGKFKVLAKTSTSVTVENQIASAEGPITLGSDFANQFQIYSAAGVQVGDTVVLSDNFSIVSQGSYKVTDVTAKYIEIYSTDVLPQESNISSVVDVYSTAKKFVYVESTGKVDMEVNGVEGDEINPFIINNSTLPGLFVKTATIWSLTITNTGTDVANILAISIE